MRLTRHIGWIMSGLLVFCAPVLSGCSKQQMSQEMREQETEMIEEARRWADELPQWTGMHQDMRAWHAGHAVSPSDTAAVRAHETRLASHEADVADFSRVLEEHRSRLQAEAKLPEDQRITAHAGLWATHVKLKATYELVARAHREIGEEHQKIVASVEAKQAK